MQNAPAGSDAFTTVATTTTRGKKGFVDLTVATRPGSWRLRWTPAEGGDTLTSRVAAGAGK